ncbi:MAG: PaaI family thioesterase [Candidatus Rokuibacteriota bacterium]|nr:MAG: PaaI family thioesterase [Candidatus Rokubacteria bacterium]
MARMLDGMEALLRGEVPPPAAATLLGMRLASFAAGEALVELDATGAHGNPMGTVQGGILGALADAAMGWAFMTTLGEDESYTTVEMKVNFLRAVRAGRIAARARVKNAGRTLGLVECDVLDAGGKLVAHAVSTCMILRELPADGR